MRALLRIDCDSRQARSIEAASRAISADWPAGGEQPCSLALVLATAAHGALDCGALRAAGEALGARAVAAAHVGGWIAGGEERAGLPGVAMLALGGDAQAALVDDARGRENEVGEELAAALGPFDAAGLDLVLLLADAHDLDARALARGLAACAPARVLGLGVEGPGGGAAEAMVGAERARGGVLGVRIRCGERPSFELAPSVRLREPLRVGRARGNWIDELDGVAALEELRDAAGALWDDERRMLRNVLVARADEGARGAGALPSAALARSVVGVDRSAGAIALAEPAREGECVAFATRDARTALEALSGAASRIRARADACAVAAGGLGLALSCPRRGAELFGESGIEAAYLARAFGSLPWLGLVGSYQLAPLHSSLMTSTGVLALLPSPREPW